MITFMTDDGMVNAVDMPVDKLKEILRKKQEDGSYKDTPEPYLTKLIQVKERNEQMVQMFQEVLAENSGKKEPYSLEDVYALFEKGIQYGQLAAYAEQMDDAIMPVPEDIFLVWVAKHDMDMGKEEDD